MPIEAYVGRVGGLAVALGVGAAVVTGWGGGVAWADGTAGAAGSTVSGTASGSEAAVTDSSGTTTRAPQPGATPSGDTGTPTTTSTKTDASGSGSMDGAVRSAPPGVAMGTGGFEQSPSAPTTRTPQPGPTGKLAKPMGSDVSATRSGRKAPAPESSVGGAKRDATVVASATDEKTTESLVKGFSPEANPTVRTEDAASSRIAVTPVAAVATTNADLTPAPPASTMPSVVGVVSRLVLGVVNAMLSPFAASVPGTPAGAPAVWSLLAFARREFEAVIAPPALTDKPANAETTSQAAALTAEQRTLVLTAFPAEADAILARTTLDPNPSVVVDGHHFYLGTLGGKKVIVAMTGIGMVNATQTAEVALDHFTPESGIAVNAVVFDGVAGGSGRTEIGDVAVPARWTSDDGASWHSVDPDMLAAANTVTVNLLSTDTVGDPACYCGLFAGPRVDLQRVPQLFVGGDGSSDDNNNGVAFPSLPSLPLIGDMFGAQPCAAPDFSLLFTGNLFQALVPFVTNGLLSNITGFLTAAPSAVDAVDQETAAAQQVADAHGIPFLGIRGMSDGPGDPLNLPGYPFTFAVYKQIAADNAAIVTEAFLENWDGA
jgi:nucleoside phosphorylase